MKKAAIILGFLVIIGGLIGGCSAHNAGISNPMAPRENERVVETEPAWGVFNIDVDIDTMQVSVLENRNAQPYFNVTQFILPPLCADCVTATAEGFDPLTRILTLNINLKNDTELCAYDVRGILILSDPVTHEVANPDGYTKKFDDSDPKNINPFIIWKNGGEEWQFPPLTTLTEEVKIIMPTPMNFQIQFVVGASFPTHSKEPMRFEEITFTGDIHDTGWYGDLNVLVTDWQDDVSCVYVDLTAFGVSNGEYPLALDIDGYWKGHIEYHQNLGLSLPEIGTYDLLVRAVDSHAFVDLYDYFEVEVTEDFSPPEWVDTVGITDVAIGAGSALIYHGPAVDPSAEVDYYLYYSQSASPYDGDYVKVTGMEHYAITGLTNGQEYIFGVRAGDQVGNIDQNVNYRVGTPQAIQLLWARTVAAEINSDPNIGDLDGDNDLDVTFGCDDGKIVALNGTDGEISWYLTTGGSIVGSPALEDINLDGLPDVIIGSGDGKMYGIRGTNGSNLGSFQTQNIIQASPVVVDFDGNGTPEAFMGSNDGKVYGLNIMSLAHFATFNAGSPVMGTPALGVLNADEYPDVLVCAGGTVYGVNGANATELWSTYLGLSAMKGSPAMADFNHDTISDAVVGTPSGVYVLDGTDGSTMWSRTDLGVDFETSPALADLTGDGTADVVISGRIVGIYAFNGANGALLWQAEGNPIVPTSPVIADVTGDGKLDVIAGSAEMALYIYSGKDGILQGSFPTSIAGAVTTTPAVGDVDHDGFIDIVFGTEERTMFAITTNQPLPSTPAMLPWPRFHRNQLNQGNLGASLVPQW